MSSDQISRTIIGEIVVIPTEALPGQSVLVEVLSPEGRSYDNAEIPHVSINGVLGSRQYLQFPRPGIRTVYVVAKRDDKVEREAVRVVVKAMPDLEMDEQPGEAELKAVRGRVAGLPLLHAATSNDEAYRVAFSLGGWSPFNHGLSRRRPVIKRAVAQGSAVDPESTGMQPEVSAASDVEGSEQPRGANESLALHPVMVWTGKTKHIPLDAKPLRNSEDQLIGHATVTGPVPATRVPALRSAEESTDTPLYHWDFGDGTTMTTCNARVEHDYEQALDPSREHQQFDVRLSLRKPDGSTDEAVRTLTVFNAYAMCKKRGIIVPRTEQQFYAQVNGFGFSAKLLVTNVENIPLTLTHTRLRVVAAEPDRTSPLGPVEVVDPPIVIPAAGKAEIPISMPFSRVPKKSAGFTVHFFGNAETGEAIRVEGTFDTRAKDRASDAVTIGDVSIGHVPGFEHVLETAGAAGESRTCSAERPSPADPIAANLRCRNFTCEEVNRIVLGADAERLRCSVSALTEPADACAASPAPPVEGAECDPDNLPELTQDQLDEGWVCQAVPEVRTVTTPARFLNALKGDIILSPGGESFVGGLLRQVDPPQKYGHCGIMTRNYDQVTHSTASEERLFAFLNGPVQGLPVLIDGFEPNALKYMWPGVVTQTIDDSIFGGSMTDPDTGTPYDICAFSAGPQGADFNGQWTIVPPLVVKPDPLLETPEIRAKLHEVADEACSLAGQSHYRLYCYTDPTIAQNPQHVAPPEAGWAAGTFPSACSCFLWMTLKRQGLQLEGPDLEGGDVAGGAEVGPTTPDGLYHYTAAERLAGALWLKEQVTRRVERHLEEKLGIPAQLLNSFAKISEHVSNQMLNTLASDWADDAAKYSQAWHGPENAKDIDTVSPENALFWDSPATAGLYGWAVPLSYRQSRQEEVTVHRWKKVQAKGNLSGYVRFQGNPVAKVLVQVYDGKSDFTDVNGHYRIAGIPFGPYVVKAFKEALNGISAGASCAFALDQQDMTLDITLASPEADFRRVQMFAHITTTDDEWWRPDEHASKDYFEEVQVGQLNPQKAVYFEQRMGGEIRIELRLQIDWQAGGAIQVTPIAKMFQGPTDSTNDLDDEENALPFIVPTDEQASGQIHLYNNEFWNGDTSVITFTAVNLVQP
ncbi:MAG: hypothetical protein HY914_17630 [Desulfomonile tiedjei]|nr:hypothetical protein [Desulfomonile tiedjei]